MFMGENTTYKRLSLEQQIKIVESADSSLIDELFLNPYTHSQIINILAITSPTELIKKFSFCHPSVEDSKNVFIARCRVARNKLSDIRLLRLLSFSTDDYIWFSLISNPSLPTYMLEELAGKLEASNEGYSMDSVASHPMISFKLAAELSKHPSVEVREALATNKKTPLCILKKLTTDTFVTVQKKSLDNLHIRMLI